MLGIHKISIGICFNENFHNSCVAVHLEIFKTNSNYALNSASLRSGRRSDESLIKDNLVTLISMNSSGFRNSAVRSKKN